DDPQRSDFRGGRSGTLLRLQHAGRGAPDLDLRADQRHPALHLSGRPERASRGLAAGSRSRPRTQSLRRKGDPFRGGRVPGPAPHPDREDSRMTGSSPWRLILDSPRDGFANMALDETMLEICRRGEGASGQYPVLRLYSWTVPTLSLGRFQDA